MLFTVNPSIFRQFLVAIICDLLIVDNGFHEGWSTPMLPKFGHQDPITIRSDESSLIVNFLYIGTGIGSLSLFFLMNRIGRKTILLAAAIPKMASWVLFALANNSSEIHIARFLAGLSHGITFTVLSMYQCEITSKKLRGIVGAFMSELINGSVLLMYAMGLWLPRVQTSLMALSIQILFFVTFFFCPESPYFLVRKNKIAEAEKTLKWILNMNDVSKELEEVKRIVAMEDAFSNISFRMQLTQIFSKRENRRATLIALILATALIWCGSSAIFAYQANTYQAAGFSLPVEVSIILTGFANIVSGFACIVVIRKLGKRRILIISMPMLSFSLIIIALFFSLMESGYNVESISWIPTVFLVVYMFAHGFALYPLVYTYMGEIFSYEMKTSAAICFAVFYSVSTTGAVQFYQILVTYGLSMPFWCFGAISIIMGILIYIYVPETENKSLEEILMDLRSNQKPSVSEDADMKSYTIEKPV